MNDTHFSKGEFLEERLSLVGFPKDKVLGDLDLRPRVLGGDEGLVRPEVLRVGVECLQDEQKKCNCHWVH